MPSRVPLLAAVALAGAAILSGCSTSTVPAFDLTAPGRAGRLAAPAGEQVVVVEPSAISPLEAERIVARDAAGSISFLPEAQWADRLPRLVQARLVQTFENASRVRASRPGDGVSGDFQLNSDIRAFQLDASRGEAVVEIAVNLVDLKTGKLALRRVFSGRAPLASLSGPAVAQGLDGAMSRVLLDIVRWVGNGR